MNETKKTHLKPEIPKDIPTYEVDQKTFKAIWKGNKKKYKKTKPGQKTKIKNKNKNQYLLIKTTENNEIKIIIAKYKPY